MKPRQRLSTVAKLSTLPMATAALAIAIFIVDTKTDLEIAVASLYVAVVLLSVGFCQKRGVILVSAGCMALTVLSYFLTTSGSPTVGLINTVISLLVIGVTTLLVLKIGSAEVVSHDARAQLAHISRVTAMGELTASIAHEVNQPLTAVATSGNAGLRWLASQPPNIEKARQAFDRIVNDANRAGKIVGRVRNLAKGGRPQKGWVNINEAALEIIALTRKELMQNHISLRIQLADDVPLVWADRIQLQQVIMNLIINAIEAISTCEDGPRDLLVSSTKDKSDGVLVTVCDSGIGLERANLDHIFDAFQTTKSDGMGMGLAISRSIIEGHSGRIWATSNVPRGSVFQFTLPTGREEAP
jgi:signal transduction histidine kinase